MSVSFAHEYALNGRSPRQARTTARNSRLPWDYPGAVGKCLGSEGRNLLLLLRDQLRQFQCLVARIQCLFANLQLLLRDQALQLLHVRLQRLLVPRWRDLSWGSQAVGAPTPGNPNKSNKHRWLFRVLRKCRAWYLKPTTNTRSLTHTRVGAHTHIHTTSRT